jgi:protein phosphatase
VTCIVADIVDAVGTPTETVPVVVGAASLHQPTRSASGGSAAERAAELTAPGAAPTNGAVPPRQRRDTGRIFRISLATLVVVALLGGGGYGAYRWSQGQFFVGSSKGSVAIFHGLPQDLGPVALSSVASVAADVPVSDLPPYTRNQVEQGIVTDDEVAAQGVVQRLRAQAESCRNALATPTPTVTATPTPSPTPTGKATTPGKTPAKTPAKTPPTGTPTPGGTIAAAGGTGTPVATPTTTSSDGTGSDGTATSEDCRGLG